MEEVIQLDLHRPYLPIRDILLEPEGEISVKPRRRKNKSGSGQRPWSTGKRSLYQDVHVLGLAMRAGEVGQEVLGERCRHKSSPPRTNAPSKRMFQNLP